MKVSTINRTESGMFSKQQLDMVYNQSVYSGFLTAPFSKEAFEQQIQLKKNAFPTEMRQQLVHALKQQYQGITLSETVSGNIDLLQQENTFTVVTGHQLVAFTGPLYFIYKIAHIIRSTEELKKAYPQHNFVPVFWMATEDHDYEEIKSFHLFNRTISWETEQTGPVGRFEMKDWEPVMEQLHDLFKNHPENELFQLMEQFKGATYADTFRNMVNQLFGKYGVVIVNGDDRQLKQAFLPYMQKEVESQFSFSAITQTTEALVQFGGKAQITPREINLFYIEKGVRERLVATEKGIEISGKGTYSIQEMTEWMQQSPESFSPNVSLRPLYQEIILPNLCYVGGAGEINYWLQLKGVFDAAGIVFPLIQTRNSVIWVDKNLQEKLSKLDLNVTDLFKELHLLNKAYLEANASDEVDFSSLDAQFESLKKQLLDTTLTIDTALEQYVNAESVRMEKQLTQIKDRLYKTVKGKHDKNLKSIQQVKEKLFPENGLQERYTNFFQLNSDGNYSKTLDAMVENMQPFNGDLLVFEEE
jgi:bacillithiol biosynthesis cysteine-adding enzyme BshC